MFLPSIVLACICALILLSKSKRLSAALAISSIEVPIFRASTAAFARFLAEPPENNKTSSPALATSSIILAKFKPCLDATCPACVIILVACAADTPPIFITLLIALAEDSAAIPNCFSNNTTVSSVSFCIW